MVFYRACAIPDPSRSIAYKGTCSGIAGIIAGSPDSVSAKASSSNNRLNPPLFFTPPWQVIQFLFRMGFMSALKSTVSAGLRRFQTEIISIMTPIIKRPYDTFFFTLLFLEVAPVVGFRKCHKSFPVQGYLHGDVLFNQKG